MSRRAGYLGVSFLRSESADDVDELVDGLRVANRRLLELLLILLVHLNGQFVLLGGQPQLEADKSLRRK